MSYYVRAFCPAKAVPASKISWKKTVLDTAFRCVMVMLHWIFHLVPLAVFGVVARLVGTQGVRGFLPLGGFIVAVLLRPQGILGRRERIG